MTSEMDAAPASRPDRAERGDEAVPGDRDRGRRGGRGDHGGRGGRDERGSRGGRDERGGRGERGGGRQRLPRRTLEVKSVATLSEHLVEMVFGGELEDWEVSGGGGHFKVFLPSEDGEQVARTYTVRRFDAAASELTIDFAIHADGPATAFARLAGPGSRLEVSGGSRPGFRSAPGSGWTVLFADQSALPAVAAILEQLPAGHVAHVFVEIPTLDERIPLPTSADVELHWIAEADAPCAALVEQALDLDLPAGVGEVWVGCEAGAMRTIRRDLLLGRGLSRTDVHTRAYWKQGVVAHSDHDTGDDIGGAE